MAYGLWLPEVGDNGGGSTQDRLELAPGWQQLPVFPPFVFSSATDYLDGWETQVAATLPGWRDELYLEFHRGCFTTEADRPLAIVSHNQYIGYYLETKPPPS
ncbi:MAG: hypothetical protein ACRCU2_29690 [Planktothrix sp.]